MNKYTSKAITVDARQWTGPGDFAEGLQVFGNAPFIVDKSGTKIPIASGDYIIKFPDGSFSAMTIEEFEMQFEIASTKKEKSEKEESKK